MSETILIVEDEFFIAFEMQSILERNGYKVIGVAADMDSAIVKAAGGVSLALVDLHLRDGLTGPQIGARLSGEFDASVIFVTANPRILGDGVSGTIGVITKPADPQALLSAVAYALERRRGHPVDPPQSLVCFS